VYIFPTFEVERYLEPCYKQQAKLFSSLFFGIFRRYGFSQLHAYLFSKLMRILSYKKGLRMFRAVAEPELPRASSTMRRLSQMAFSTQNKQFFKSSPADLAF
jgi:hypothetical protein